MRIVLALSSESGSVSGTLRTAEGSWSFRGWLALMSALELAAGASAADSASLRPIAQDGPSACLPTGEAL